MTMITPSYLGETIEYSSLHACRSTLEDPTDADEWRERLLASVSCRAAVRKGRPLTPEQARDLLERLAGARAPAVCPHGSPIILHLSDRFLARQFDWG